jgi:hypothetical protein
MGGRGISTDTSPPWRETGQVSEFSARASSSASRLVRLIGAPSAGSTGYWIQRGKTRPVVTRVETRSVMWPDAERLRVSNGLDVYEGHTRAFTKSWTFCVPRELV